MRTLVHVVPAVPPAIDGVSDYARKLWQHWPSPRPPWRVATRHAPPGASEAWPEVEIASFGAGPSQMERVLNEVPPASSTLVLHYVGYAYHPRGVPTWLPDVARGWKRGGGKVVVMFHEMWAGGTPQSSSFWLQPWSRGIARELAGLCDGWVTSCHAARDKLVLEGRADPGKGTVIPIGSAFEPGELTPAEPIDWHRPWPLDLAREQAPGRGLKLVIFGLPTTRLWILQAHHGLLREVCARSLVESITLLGKSGGGAPVEEATAQIQELVGAPKYLWRTASDLSAVDLSRLLREQDAGLLAGTSDLLLKSSTYAALCAHGVVPLCAAGRQKIGRARAQVLEPLQVLGEAQVLALPFVASEDAKPGEGVSQLGDACAMQSLRQQARIASEQHLSWPAIAARWADWMQTCGAYPD